MITPIRTMTIDQICERKDDLLIGSDDVKTLAKSERDKAIDEFVKKIEWEATNHWVFDLEDEEEHQNFLDEIIALAEQMKGE